MSGHANRVIVNSIPKSGTYLVGLILSFLGVREVGLHLRDQHFWDWNKATDLDHVIRDPDAYMAKLSDGQELPHFDSGFVYAHFNTTETARAYISSLKPCCHIFCVRDLRDCLVSSCRFEAQRAAINGKPETLAALDNEPRQTFLHLIRTRGPQFLNAAARQAGWAGHPGVSLARFEIVAGQRGADAFGHWLEELGSRLDLNVGDIDAAAMLTRAMGTKTRTRSGAQRSAWQNYWSEDADALFEQFGGPAINRRIGYGCDA